jgi:hypothetical protein
MLLVALAVSLPALLTCVILAFNSTGAVRCLANGMGEFGIFSPLLQESNKIYFRASNELPPTTRSTSRMKSQLTKYTGAAAGIGNCSRCLRQGLKPLFRGALPEGSL